MDATGAGRYHREVGTRRDATGAGGSSGGDGTRDSPANALTRVGTDAPLLLDDDPRVGITSGMHAALVVGIGVFVLGVGVPLLAMAWFAVLLALITLAGTTLLHTGGLDPATIKPAMAVAVALAGVLLTGLWRTPAAAESDGRQPDATWARRNPAGHRCVWLLAVAGLTSLAASPGSPYFPSPWATTAVLTATCFLIVVGFVAVWRLFDQAWQGLYRVGRRGPYPAGLLTGVLLLLGGLGGWAHHEGLSREPWRVLRAEAELAKVKRPHGAVDIGLKALCLGAGETEPALARDAGAAPGCQFLPGANDDDDCFESLLPSVPVAKGMLRRDFHLGAFDADDVAMEALLTTCIAPVARDRRRAYFFKVVRNQGNRQVVAARRVVGCDQFDDAVAAKLACTMDDDAGDRTAKLGMLWEAALCTFDERTAGVIRSRLVDELSFRDTGRRWKMSATKAKDTFNNAIKKLRSLGVGDCFREWL